ncbi:MAG: hypothetical protein IKM49_02750, partial [Ruminococcus sp.]|nr:hypothetical protein [Ruminococcus sp.]
MLVLLAESEPITKFNKVDADDESGKGVQTVAVPDTLKVEYVQKVTVTAYTDDTFTTELRKVEISPLDVKQCTYTLGSDVYTIEAGPAGDVKKVTVNGTEVTDEETLGKIKLAKPEGVTDPGKFLVFYDGELMVTNADLSKKLGEGPEGVKFEFVNDKALTFKKVDEDGNQLRGADIEMTSGAVTFTFDYAGNTIAFDGENASVFTGWNWNTGTSSSTIIDYNALENAEPNIGSFSMGMWGTSYYMESVDYVYRIREIATPTTGEYENAKDIILFKYNDVIYYTRVAQGANISNFPLAVNNNGAPTISVPEGWETIDLAESTAKQRVITMENVEIQGAKIKLQKVNQLLTSSTVAGSTIELYKGDGTKIFTWEDFDGSDDIFDNEEFKKANGDSGYLKPGLYYFVETQAPTGYSDALVGTPMYFMIYADNSITAGKPSVMPISVYKKDNNVTFLVDANGNTMNANTWDGSVGFANVTKITLKVSANIEQLHTNLGQITDGAYDSSTGTYVKTFSEPTNISKFEVQNWSSGITVTGATVETSDGLNYEYGSMEPAKSYTVNYKLNYADGTSQTSSFTATENGDKAVMLQNGNFAIPTGNVESVEITLDGNATATYFEVIADDWSSSNKATSSEAGSSATLTLPSVSTSLMQIYIGGLSVADADDSDNTEETDTFDSPLLISSANKVFTIAIPNAPYVSISKQDVAGAELAGAELTLTGKTASGEDITFSTNDVILGAEASFSDNNSATALSWISGNTPTSIKNLPDGIYTLHEEVAPEGYEVATDITFVVENGAVTTINDVSSTSNGNMIV